MVTSPRNAAWIFLLLFIAALTPRLLIVAQPIPVQLDRTLPDDAYYYFLTARNIGAGRGPSVDGIHDSNGWHPLWMVVNTAIFSPDWQNADTPVRVALTIGAVCDSLVVVVLFWALHRRLNSGAAILAGGLYALNVMPMFQSVNGLETGLAALLLALAWWTTLSLCEHPRSQFAVIWGAVFGLTFLARTDTALILAPLGLFALWQLRRSWRLLLIGGGVALIIVAPWFVWNQANFGSPLDQTSSSAVPYAARERVAAASPDVSFIAESLRVLTYPQYWLRGDYLGAPPLIGFLLWVLGLLGIVRALRDTSLAARQLACLTIALLVGGAALVLVHTMVRWYPRPWYFVITAQSLSIALALLWFTTSRAASSRVRLARAATLFAGIIGITAFSLPMWQIGLYPWQSEHQYAAAQWTRANLPDDVLLASMNSGIIGYYSGHDTVNLDGVVNAAAFAAIRERKLLRFMQTTGVDYFLDSDYAIRGEYALFMGAGYPSGLRELQPVTAEYPGLGVLRVYAVEPTP